MESSHGGMNHNNQMAIDLIVNQRALPPPRGNRPIRPHGRKYNSYTPEMRTRIAKYAMMAGDLEAAQHFSRELGHKVAVTSVWRFRKAYTRELKRIHQEGGLSLPSAYALWEKRPAGARRGGRSRALAGYIASPQQGQGDRMEEGAECDWTPPTDAEMKVIQARKERSDKISKLMGDYLLKGYRMLATTCPICGTILLRDKHQKDYCVTCCELDTEHAKDDPALSAAAARSQVREQELIGTSPQGSAAAQADTPPMHPHADTSISPLVITNVRSASAPASMGGGGGGKVTMQPAPHPQPPPPAPQGVPAHRVHFSPAPPQANHQANPQATVLPQTQTSARNPRVDRVLGQSLEAVLAKLQWASEELNQSSSVQTCTQLCRLIQACADAVDSLNSAGPK